MYQAKQTYSDRYKSIRFHPPGFYLTDDTQLHRQPTMPVMAPQPTVLTECGLKASLERIIATPVIFDRNSDDFSHLCSIPSMYMFRKDGRMLEISLVKNGLHYQDSDSWESLYEISFPWHGLSDVMDGGMDDANGMGGRDTYVMAMNRYMHTPDRHVVVDVCRSDLTSIYSRRSVVPRLMRSLQHLLDITLCECGQNMIPDNRMVCLTCCATLKEKDLSKHMCGVCHETCHAKISQTGCCRQWIHNACKNKCEGQCPFCRARFINID